MHCFRCYCTCSKPLSIQSTDQTISSTSRSVKTLEAMFDEITIMIAVPVVNCVTIALKYFGYSCLQVIICYSYIRIHICDTSILYCFFFLHYREVGVKST